MGAFNANSSTSLKNPVHPLSVVDISRLFLITFHSKHTGVAVQNTAPFTHPRKSNTYMV